LQPPGSIKAPSSIVKVGDTPKSLRWERAWSERGSASRQTEAGEIIGWCHITSEHPVVPWGLTGWTAAEGGDMGFATMNSFRAESGLLGEVEVTPV
jgi:hypothetical protein